MVRPAKAFAAQEVSEKDLQTVAAQLGRTPRDVLAIAHRCPCGAPDVVQTPPRLADGTPFPTFYYATCPRLTGAISTLESSGLMAQMNERLQTQPELAGNYMAAHIDYEASRDSAGRMKNIEVPEIAGVTAGGMPDRVKCLHSLVAHALAAGEDVNQLGDEALIVLDQWWMSKPCSEITNLINQDS